MKNSMTWRSKCESGDLKPKSSKVDCIIGFLTLGFLEFALLQNWEHWILFREVLETIFSLMEEVM